MSRVCQLTGTGPVTGSRIRRSGKAKKKGGIGMHITKVVKRRFLPNLQHHRFWVESENRFVRLRLSAKGMRIIDKRGIDVVLSELRARGEKV